MTTIDVAGDFGGPEVHERAVAHWQALKTAAQALQLHGVPLETLTLILRVSGSVKQFRPEGLDALKFEPGDVDASVDLCVAGPLPSPHAPASLGDEIPMALRRLAGWLRDRSDPRLGSSDWTALEQSLIAVCDRYLQELPLQKSRIDPAMDAFRALMGGPVGPTDS